MKRLDAVTVVRQATGATGEADTSISQDMRITLFSGRVELGT